jgi:hypothetical protein
VSSVSNGLYFQNLPLVSVMRVIYTSKGMSKKFGGARYTLGARYLSKNTVHTFVYKILPADVIVDPCYWGNTQNSCRWVACRPYAVVHHDLLSDVISTSSHCKSVSLLIGISRYRGLKVAQNMGDLLFKVSKCDVFSARIRPALTWVLGAFRQSV